MTDQAARPAPGRRAVPAQRVVLTGLAMLSVLAAVIHFAVAGGHFQEYWLFGVFMLGVAWLHTNLCLRAGFGVAGVTGAGHPACPAGSRNRVTPAMMHIWFVPIPGGPTAVDATSAQVVQAAEQVAAPHNGTA